MNEVPRPSSWPSAFLGACVAIFIGAVALQLAVDLLRSIAPVLVLSAVTAAAVAIAWAWWRARRSERW